MQIIQIINNNLTWQVQVMQSQGSFLLETFKRYLQL